MAMLTVNVQEQIRNQVDDYMHGKSDKASTLDHPLSIAFALQYALNNYELYEVNGYIDDLIIHHKQPKLF